MQLALQMQHGTAGPGSDRGTAARGVAVTAGAHSAACRVNTWGLGATWGVLLNRKIMLKRGEKKTPVLFCWFR